MDIDIYSSGTLHLIIKYACEFFGPDFSLRKCNSLVFGRMNEVSKKALAFKAIFLNKRFALAAFKLIRPFSTSPGNNFLLPGSVLVCASRFLSSS